jgi:hypothetical protein
MSNKKPINYPKTIVVRISLSQYQRLLETIIKNNKLRKDNDKELTQIDKSKILREMIDRYVVPKIS